MHVHSFVTISFVAFATAATVTHPVKRQGTSANPAVSTKLATNWKSIGCWSDSPQNRVLAVDGYHDDTGMSEDLCITYCDQRGFSVAGVEHSSECFCGYSLGKGSTQIDDNKCNQACTGNCDQLCGGNGAMNVFTNGDPAPITNPGVNGYSSIGCFADTPSFRILPNSMQTSGGSKSMSVKDCTSACAANGYSYAGVEFGQECYCATSLPSYLAPTDCGDGCNKACTGNRKEFCGGAARINVYYNPSIKAPVAGDLPDGWKAVSCYSDSPSQRTLKNQINLSSPTTVEGCLSACQSRQYSLGGVEYGSECYCSNDVPSDTLKASDGCSMSCQGNKAEICGGAGRINVYQYTPN